MTATTATFPGRQDDTPVLAGLVTGLVETAKEAGAALTGAFTELLSAGTAGETPLARLYRLSANVDSVSPQVLKALRNAA